MNLATTLIRRHPLLPVVGTLGLAILACAKPTAPETPDVPSFSYEPTQSDAGKGISLALLKPQLPDSYAEAARNSYQGYEFLTGNKIRVWASEPAITRATREAVGRSLVEYFTASGFTVSGPFESAEEMTFPEKKQADLLLSVEFGIAFQVPPLVWTGDSPTGPMPYSEGPCMVVGSISFVLWEPLSMQRMWAKSVEVKEAQTADCTVKVKSAEQWKTLMENRVAPLHEEAFEHVMNAAERYFNPEEVALVKKQAEEVREKKVY